MKLTGVFSRGSGGPHGVQLCIDSGTGTISYGQPQTLDPGPTWIRTYLETKPDTLAAWTPEQINALRSTI